MTKRETINDLQTEFLLEDIYKEFMEIAGKTSLTRFAEILGTSKQNISRKISYGAKLLVKEKNSLCKFLSSEKLLDNDLFEKLADSGKGMPAIKEVEQASDDTDDFVDVPVRGELSISCGYGMAVYNQSKTGTCKVPRKTLREYGASLLNTEIVYAAGDSMMPDIAPGDALLVDKSQIEVIDGVVFAFNYEGQPMCKRLQKVSGGIKAISRNPAYEPIMIDENSQFNIVGRVVGFLRAVL